jgi:hypothetical protein
LRNAPAGGRANRYGEVVFAADGSAWTQVMNEDKLTVFVSHDRGRTWPTVPLSGQLPQQGLPELITRDGHTVYLFHSDTGVIWRTRDEGRHWEGFAVPTRSPEDVSMEAAGLDDGGLFVCDNNLPRRRCYILAAAGDRLEPVDTPPLASVSRAGAVLLGAAVSAQPSNAALYRSSDGRTWVRLNL